MLETIHTVPFLGDRRLVYVRRFDRMKLKIKSSLPKPVNKVLPGPCSCLPPKNSTEGKATKVLLCVGRPRRGFPCPGEGLLIGSWPKPNGSVSHWRRRAALLAERWGNQPDGIVSELEKVAAHVGQGHLATAEDVLTVVAAAGRRRPTTRYSGFATQRPTDSAGGTDLPGPAARHRCPSQLCADHAAHGTFGTCWPCGSSADGTPNACAASSG